MITKHTLLLVTLIWTSTGLPAQAIHSRITDAAGETVFSPEFLQGYEAAIKAAEQSKSAEQVEQLLTKYKQPNEIAELELTLGILYGQRTGLVDPEKAIEHFNRALQYEFPEQTYLEIIMWRGNAHEQLKNHREALQDYLRGLLACSYQELSGGWPLDARPRLDYDIRSADAQDVQRAMDYRRYLQRITAQRFLLMQRYYLIDAVKRMQNELEANDQELRTILEELSSDTSRYGLILEMVHSENKRPWP